MSDFLYSKNNISTSILAKMLKEIYHEEAPLVYEYYGLWGSLAVTRSLYNGFQPLETESHICIIIGGPVLTFRNNRFLSTNESSRNNEGTKAVYERWLNGNIVWDRDLSGPFAV